MQQLYEELQHTEGFVVALWRMGLIDEDSLQDIFDCITDHQQQVELMAIMRGDF